MAAVLLLLLSMPVLLLQLSLLQVGCFYSSDIGCMIWSIVHCAAATVAAAVTDGLLTVWMLTGKAGGRASGRVRPR